MNILWLNISLLAASLFVLQACKDPVIEEPADLGLNFQPMSVGDWWVYEVDSIDHNAFTQTVDTFHFYLREELANSFVDLEGELAFSLKRYRKLTWEDQWELSRVWQAKIDGTSYQRVENNIRYVRLAFPVDLSTEWDGNAFNTQDHQLYEYDEIGGEVSIKTKVFEDAAVVLQKDNRNLIEIQEATESYARGVGMVYKSDVDLDLQTESGYELTMAILDYSITQP